MIHPAVRDLFLDLARHPAFQAAQRRLLSGGNSSISGLTTTAKAAYSVLLWQATGRPLIIVVDGNKEAEALSEVGRNFLQTDGRRRPPAGRNCFPRSTFLPLQNLSPHAEICEQRAIGLWRLGHAARPGHSSAGRFRADARRAGRVLPPTRAADLRPGDEVPLEDVVAHLESVGYERREPVEMVGEYSVRGGILDVFSPESQKPVRIDLFGDLVESIRRFDVESQRSVLKVEECTLLPLTEYQKSRALLAELGELVRESGIPGRDLAAARRAIPRLGIDRRRWSARANPRSSACSRGRLSFGTSPSKSAPPPSVSGSAWSKSTASPAYDPDRIYFRWEEIERSREPLPATLPQGTGNRLDAAT